MMKYLHYETSMVLLFDLLPLPICFMLQVTLGERAHGLADPANAGTKLSPEGFHAAITQFDHDSTVLMDVRNVYESDIGFFNVVRTNSFLSLRWL